MKVKVKLSDALLSHAKNVSMDADANIFVELEAEPIECPHGKWTVSPDHKEIVCDLCGLRQEFKIKIEEEVEWERGLKCTLEGDGKISDGCEDCIEHIKSFNRNLLKELVTELFHSPTTAEAWKRIYKKYGIED